MSALRVLRITAHGKLVAGTIASILAFTAAPLSVASAREPVISLLEYRQRNMVVQEWDLSCGAAALATLLRYQHGMQVTEKEIAASLINRPEYLENPELLRIKQGFSLLDLKRYVTAAGLVGDGFGGLTLENLLEMAPVLIPVRLQGYNHFVVFRGLAGRRALVADPAWGNRTLMVDDFMQAWMEIGELGRVGFTVTDDSTPAGTHPLTPDSLDFVMLR
jgi:predicted double-glycine peptidase